MLRQAIIFVWPYQIRSQTNTDSQWRVVNFTFTPNSGLNISSDNSFISSLGVVDSTAKRRRIVDTRTFSSSWANFWPVKISINRTYDDYDLLKALLLLADHYIIITITWKLLFESPILGIRNLSFQNLSLGIVVKHTDSQHRQPRYLKTISLLRR